jgi:hypothetical protein
MHESAVVGPLPPLQLQLTDTVHSRSAELSTRQKLMVLSCSYSALADA